MGPNDITSQLTAQGKLTVMEELIDRLVDARGREKCKVVCVMNDMIAALKQDVQAIEEQIKTQKQNILILEEEVKAATEIKMKEK